MAFTVGQLAKLTGLTVRALHHYDAIGLLVPSHRSDSGYRLYGQADIARLYQIQALRRLGLSLTEIEQALARNGASLPDLIAQQIDELNDRIDEAAALRARLTQLRDVLAAGGEPVANDWLVAAELITRYDRYCSPDELNRLLTLGKTYQGEWPRLVADVRAAMAGGVAPETDEAQALGQRWKELTMSQVGGDTALAIKMKLAYFDQPELQARLRAQSGLDPALLEYLTRIWRHANVALWTRHLGADEAARLNTLDDRMREWLRVVARMRDVMKSAASLHSDVVQSLLAEWDSLLDAFSVGDADLKRRMLKALESDTELQSAWAVDGELQAFVGRARERMKGKESARA